jgi:hypothetical protein
MTMERIVYFVCSSFFLQEISNSKEFEVESVARVSPESMFNLTCIKADLWIN